jgi:hypothetical protein
MNTVNPDEIFDTKYKGESYIDDYQLFMKNLDDQGGNMAAGEVGEMVTRMANHYIRYNTILARTLKLFNAKASEIYAQQENGKPISAAKAEIIAAATVEAAAYQQAKVDVQNIEQCINALKALQRGILNEYSHSAT